MLDLSFLSVGPADGPAAEGAVRPGANGVAGVDALDVIDAFATLVDALAPATPDQPTAPPAAATTADGENPAPAVFAQAPVLIPLVSVPPQGFVPTVPPPATVQSGLAPDWADLPVPGVDADDDDDRTSAAATLVVVEIVMPAATPLPMEPPAVTPAMDAPVDEETLEAEMEAPVFRPALNAPVARPALETPLSRPGVPVTRSMAEAPVTTPTMEAPVFGPALDTPAAEAPVLRPALNTPAAEAPIVRSTLYTRAAEPVPNAPAFGRTIDTHVAEEPVEAPVVRPALNAPVFKPLNAPDGDAIAEAPAVTPVRTRNTELFAQTGKAPRTSAPAAAEPAASPRPIPDVPRVMAKPIADVLEATIASLKLHAFKTLRATDAVDPMDSSDANAAAAIDLLRARSLRQPSVVRTTAPEPVTIADPLPAFAAWQLEPVMARLRSAIAPEPARVIVTRGAASVDLLTATAGLAPSTTTRAATFEFMPPAATVAGAATAVHIPDTPSPETVAQLVQSIRMQWARGGGEAQIRLEPRHFGEVTVSVRVDRETVSVRLQAEAPAVREWLQTQQQVLRTGLAEQRLTLDRLEITEPSRHEPFDSRDDRQSHPRERRESRRGRPSDPNATFDLEA